MGFLKPTSSSQASVRLGTGSMTQLGHLCFSGILAPPPLDKMRCLLIWIVYLNCRFPKTFVKNHSSFPRRSEFQNPYILPFPESFAFPLLHPFFRSPVLSHFRIRRGGTSFDRLHCISEHPHFSHPIPESPDRWVALLTPPPPISFFFFYTSWTLVRTSQILTFYLWFIHVVPLVPHF